MTMRVALDSRKSARYPTTIRRKPLTLSVVCGYFVLMSRTTQHAPAHAPSNEPITVDVQEACRLSGLGETYLRGLIGDGTLECRYAGSKRLITYTSLKAYLLGLPQDRVA